MYSFTDRVRYSETDRNCNLTLEAIIDYFQDCSTFHSESLGVGIEYLTKRNLAWVLSSWQIVVNRYPHLYEEIKVGTFAYDFKGFMGFRNFVLEDVAGNRIAYANSIWSLMNMEKMQPEKLTKEMVEGYAQEEKLHMDYEPRKITILGEGIEEEEITVKNYQIDSNEHVNNGQYVRMAMEYLPKDFKIGQMRAEYKKSAVLHDKIIPVLYKNGENRLVALCNTENAPYAVVEFSPS